MPKKIIINLYVHGVPRRTSGSNVFFITGPTSRDTIYTAKYDCPDHQYNAIIVNEKIQDRVFNESARKCSSIEARYKYS